MRLRSLLPRRRTHRGSLLKPLLTVFALWLLARYLLSLLVGFIGDSPWLDALAARLGSAALLLFIALLFWPRARRAAAHLTRRLRRRPANH